MRPGKTLMVEVSSISPISDADYYADLEMPATDYEITDVLQRTRLTNRDVNTAMAISVNGCEILPELMDHRLDSPTIKELNFFANRLKQLSQKEAVAIRAVFQQMDADGLLEEPVSMKDLINMTYGLDKVTVVWGMWDDEDLGRHVLDNNIHPELSKLGKETAELVDLASVGKWLRKAEGGRLMSHAYVATRSYEFPQVYDGQTLPSTEYDYWYAFRMKVTGESGMKSDWLNLPCDRKHSDAVAKSVGMRKIEDCELSEFESSHDSLEQRHFGSMDNFEMLNALALRMAQMSPPEKVRFKAVLEADPQETLEGFLDISHHLRDYEFMPFASTYAEFFREYLQHHLGTGFDEGWLSNLVCRSEGQELLERLGAKITGYGVVSARGHSLFEMVPFRQAQSQAINQTDNTPIEDQTSGMDAMKL